MNKLERSSIVHKIKDDRQLLVKIIVESIFQNLLYCVLCGLIMMRGKIKVLWVCYFRNLHCKAVLREKRYHIFVHPQAPSWQGHTDESLDTKVMDSDWTNSRNETPSSAQTKKSDRAVPDELREVYLWLF